MESIIHLGRVTFVKVPMDATNIHLGGKCNVCLRSGIVHCAHADTCGNAIDILYYDEDKTELPEGNCTILGRALELTEEDKRICVAKENHGYYINYKAFDENYDFSGKLPLCDTSNDSYTSLLEAHNIDNNYVVILNETE